MRSLCALLFALLTLAAAPALAQQATVTMTASTTRVAVGDAFVLRVHAQVQGAVLRDVELPDLSAFDVMSRQVSRPFSVSVGLGGQRAVLQSSTEYVMQLRALAPGAYHIQPAKALVGNQTFSSAPLTIVVTGSAGAATGPQGGGPQGGGPQGDASSSGPPGQGQAQIDGARFDQQVFLRTVADVSKPFVGQQVTVTVYLYIRNGLGLSSDVTQEPTTDGFWIQKLPTASQPSMQVVQGIPYRVFEVRRFAAFPLHAGDLTIGPMEVRSQTNSLFSMLQGSRVFDRKGVPVTIHVQPLPAPVPNDAVVGDYHIQATLDRTTVTTGDAATFRVTVSGTGNLHDVQLALPNIAGLRILSPQVQDDIEQPNDRVGGTRVFEWLIVPEKPGKYAIPPVGFHAFDPQARVYHDVRTGPLTLEAVGHAVADADEGSPKQSASGASSGKAPEFGPIRANSRLARATTPVTARPWYAGALAAPPFMWLAVLGIGGARRRWRLHGRAKEGERSVRRRLREANGYVREDRPREFYGAVSQALTRALASRLDEPVGGFTHQELRQRLGARGMDAELTERVMDELEGCDYARFSASGVTADEMRRCLARVGALLERIEKFRPQPEEVAS